MTELKCGITWDSHIHAGKHHCAQLLNEHSGSHTCDQCDAELPLDAVHIAAPALPAVEHQPYVPATLGDGTICDEMPVYRAAGPAIEQRGETPRDIDDFSEYKRGFQDAQKMLAPSFDDKDAIIGHSCSETLIAKYLQDPEWAARFKAESARLDTEDKDA